MRFTIFARDDEKSLSFSEQLKDDLKKIKLMYDDENPEIVFCVGGDGTFLRAVHRFYECKTPTAFIGINSGSLGFFCSYDMEDISSLIDDLKNDRLNFVEYPLLEASLYNGDDFIDRLFAVNEIRIENPFKTMICDVHIDNDHLEEFRGNGLLVSSTLGSSAYNKSCGGALIDSDIHLLELTEIAPIENVAYRSLRESVILSPKRQICFNGPFQEEVIGYDHSLYHFSEQISHIVITYAHVKIKVLKRNFVKSLHSSFISNKKGE